MHCSVAIPRGGFFMTSALSVPANNAFPAVEAGG